ncbi:CGNR zinc finger [Actinomadura rubteroloni]|uniref:CGNR zinc finger n=1 Tax=Actinomadura rubteroloni TaxID=1926885 RepID=A0A2P4UH83_9ACTN|nr:CGNR zinc finger domain-containing protein [Actinomadura rubteroloni]POM24423.1 CGNR zinc finger [Actinomadura rubteroloni]
MTATDAALLLRDFVNTLDAETGTDELAAPDRLTAWLRSQNLLPPGTAAGPADLRTAVALREGLRDALRAHHDGAAPGRGLDAVLAGLPLRVAVPGDADPVLVPVGDGAATALARLAAAVMAAVAGGTWQRLKICPACAWAFLDTSRNRSRTWCSMRVCGNRTKTRAYRARRAAPDETAPPRR